MGEITDRYILPDAQLKIPAAGGKHEPAFDSRRPDDLFANDAPDMIEHRVTFVASAAGRRVLLRAEHKRIRPVNTGQPQLAHGLRYRIRITSYVRREFYRGMAASLADTLYARGGRRPVKPNSVNDRWRNKSFQGYADYMETKAFEDAVSLLQTIASEQRTAMMCSEAVWWRCHRSMVSDYLKAKGWTVWHIMAAGKADEHPYTSPARVEGGRVFYSDKNLFNQ